MGAVNSVVATKLACALALTAAVSSCGAPSVSPQGAPLPLPSTTLAATPGPAPTPTAAPESTDFGTTTNLHRQITNGEAAQRFYAAYWASVPGRWQLIA